MARWPLDGASGGPEGAVGAAATMELPTPTAFFAAIETVYSLSGSNATLSMRLYTYLPSGSLSNWSTDTSIDLANV